MAAKGFVNIRQAVIEDLQPVCRIVKDATRSMDEQGIPQWDDIYPSEDILRDDIKMEQMRVIEIGGRTAGLIVINEEESPEYGDVAWRYSGKVMVVHRLTIDPSCQRGGLATRLMDFAEGIAAAEGYGCIRLDAFIQNPAAMALYEKRGYRKAGSVRFRKGQFFCYEKQISRTVSGDERIEKAEFRSRLSAGDSSRT
jgi:ribosomal protein S18 acetylase RimI-like enzyme